MSFLYRLDQCFSALGNRKDGVLTFIAIVVLLVGGFSYFDSRLDARTRNALEILERREADTFVKARSILVRKWLEEPGLNAAFSATGTYTSELIEKTTEAIFDDADYRSALFDISTYYSNAVACVLDGQCDVPTMCASLRGEIQDYLEINEGYFTEATVLRREDAVSLYRGMPEFVEFCSDKLFVRVASRHDGSTDCRISRYLERFLGLGWESACTFDYTAYGQRVTETAEILRVDAKYQRWSETATFACWTEWKDPIKMDDPTGTAPITCNTKRPT